jgi:hypothetical protein
MPSTPPAARARRLPTRRASCPAVSRPPCAASASRLASASNTGFPRHENRRTPGPPCRYASVRVPRRRNSTRRPHPSARGCGKVAIFPGASATGPEAHSRPIGKEIADSHSGCCCCCGSAGRVHRRVSGVAGNRGHADANAHRRPGHRESSPAGPVRPGETLGTELLSVLLKIP